MRNAPLAGWLGSAAMCLVAMLGAAGLALAQDAASPSQTELIEALKSKATRSAKVGPSAADAAAEAEDDKLIESLRSKVARGLSVNETERTKLAVAAEKRPKFDFEINFDFNSADITERSRPVLMSLGQALMSNDLKGSNFMVAGHTDAKGRASYNQELSERRAAAVRAFLLKNFTLSEEQLMAIGYGSEKLKNPDKPYADENRRVQVVNISPVVSQAKP